jgi:uncharacterized membrane protein
MAMAIGDDPEPLGSPGTNQGNSQLTALEERIARLERELADLQLEVASQAAAPKLAEPLVPAAPPPPPIPSRPDTPASSSAARPLTSDAWASPRPIPAHVPESRDSLESRLGSQFFNRIAIVLLLIGTAYGMKWSVDHGWIGPTGRVILGLIAGAALVVWSERFRSKGFAAFSYSLKAVGSGVLYLSLWAAFHLYGLLPSSVALALMVLVTAWNAYMAWAQDSELLAVYALAGGFATPMLLSSGGNHELFLFTYLLAIDVATVALVRLRHFPRLLIGAFPLTVLYFTGWYASFYSPDQLAPTSAFLLLFAATFASVPLAPAADEDPSASPACPRSTLLEDILLPLANAANAALAGYCLLQYSGDHALLPWLMVALAAAYLALMRAPQTAVASAIHLSLAIVLLTIAIPLKASGHWITVTWLVEGLALVWVATRLGAGYAPRTLRWLGVASLALGFGGVTVHLLGVAQEFDVSFLNKGTGTALTAIALFAAAAWLSLRAAIDTPDAPKYRHDNPWSRTAMGAFLLIAMTALLLTLRELGASWFGGYSSYPHPPFQSADFAMALLALAIFAGVVAVSLQIARQRTTESFWINCAALSTIAFNLIAIFTGVREIIAVWGISTALAPDAGLQQALAISAFLMLYGAALLAAGFWKRSSFLRWQALLLLLFTICKTFLYDMRNLSQGYRVVSFLGLGALLLAISFAYQKDWLHLREPDANPAAGPAQDSSSGAAK